MSWQFWSRRPAFRAAALTATRRTLARVVRERDTLREQLDKERDRNNQLTLDLVKLYQIVSAPPPTPDEQARKDWAEVEVALDAVGLTGAARRQQADWAERMMRRGVKAGEVAQQIRQGGDDDF